MASAFEAAESAISRFHWRLEVLVGLCLAFSGGSVAIMSSAMAQIMKDWSLSPVDVSVVMTANAIGMLLGAIAVGNVADRWGRKVALQSAIFFLALGTGLSAFAFNFYALAFFQFISGIGNGGVSPPMVTLVTEFAPAKYRGRLLGLMETFWINGWVIAYIFAYLVVPQYGWRTAFLFGIFPLVYIPILGKVIPESLRFLVTRGRHDEAHRTVRVIKGRYGVDLALGLANPTGAVNVKTRFAELWSPRFIRRTLCTWIVWFVLVFTNNGIFMWMPSLLVAAGQGVARSFEFGLLITLFQLPGAAGAAFIMDRVGRKRVLVVGLLLSGVGAFMFGLSTGLQELLVWASLISVASLAGWAVLLAYTPELFPTRMRGTAAGLASASGRAGGIFVPVVMAMLLGSWGQGYGVLFGTFAAMFVFGGLAVAALGEETMGRTLEEIST